MQETDDDLARMQDLLDRSYGTAGAHLLSIHDPERRMTARQVASRLTGMCLLTLATATADGRPLTGAVDSVLFRGAFHFGSDPKSVRLRHLRTRPAVSATYLPGEELAVTVHGTAAPVAMTPQLRQALLDVYGPKVGYAEWEAFLAADPQYLRIDARRMYAFQLHPSQD